MLDYQDTIRHETRTRATGERDKLFAALCHLGRDYVRECMAQDDRGVEDKVGDALETMAWDLVGDLEIHPSDDEVTDAVNEAASIVAGEVATGKLIPGSGL